MPYVSVRVTRDGVTVEQKRQVVAVGRQPRILGRAAATVGEKG